MDYIDKLTLELFINKSQYQRYLSKADPEKYKIRQEHLDNIQRYKSEIKEMTSDLLENAQITTEINDAFETYVKCVISHLQMREYDDDDTLFSNMRSSPVNLQVNPLQVNPLQVNPLQVNPPPVVKHADLHNSFWGKPIKKE